MNTKNDSFKNTAIFHISQKKDNAKKNYKKISFLK